MEKKSKKYISSGVIQPSFFLPFHQDSNLSRRLMLNKDLIPTAKAHIAVTVVNKKKQKNKHQSKTHYHKNDEINLILSENPKNKLTYKIQLDNETYKVSSPATIYIPAKTKHQAELISGKGTFICIVLNGKYQAL